MAHTVASAASRPDARRESPLGLAELAGTVQIHGQNHPANVGEMAVEMSRLQWLMSHPEFKRDPVRVMRGVVSWEIHRLLSKNMSLELDGLKLTSRPFDGNGRLICYFGDKFDNIHEFLKIFLREGMVFVDAGANIGSHTINAASLVGRTGSVFAFEADPETYHLLLENIERNKLNNVTVRQTCVADNIGVVSFFKHKDSAKSSIVDRGEKVAVTLPADKLDNLVPTDVGIDVLKIDVEGAEMRVLNGASQIFSSPQPPSIVIIEVFDVRDSTDKAPGFVNCSRAMATSSIARRGKN
ncbi:MAG TPA: FkbM family methyltransferase [Roseiarcus sp.]